jgi:ketosteroid isomerase-like protein
VPIDEPTIRQAFEKYNRGQFEDLRDLLHPEVEWDSRATSLDGKVICGREAVIEHLKPDIFEGQNAELEAAQPVDGGFLLTIHFRQRGAGSGIELEARSWMLWEPAGDLVRRVQVFLDREEARKAAGIEQAA